MDKEIRVREPLGRGTWQERTIPLDPSWTKSVGWEREGKKGEEGESKERSSTFSLNFPAIGLSVSGGARDKSTPATRATS